MGQLLRLLVVEDSESDTLLLLRELQRTGFEPVHRRVDSPDALGAALNEPWDVVLSDYTLLQLRAPDVLGIIHEKGLDLPFIVISGTMGEDLAVEMMRLGAHDYLMKGNLARLGEAIRREMKAAHARGEQRAAYDRIQHLNTVLRAIRNVNQLIVREQDPARLVEQTCNELASTRGFATTWIYLTGDAPGGERTVESGWGEAFAPLAGRLGRGDIPPCCRRALARDAAVTVRNPFSSCSDCPLTASYQGSGYRPSTALAAALRREGHIYGFLCASVAPGLAAAMAIEEEESLLTQVAADIAFALHGIELDARRSQAEAALRESEERFRRVFNSATDGILLADLATRRFAMANRTICEMLGYTRDELLELGVEDIHPAQDLPRVGEAIEWQVSGEAPLAVDLPVKRKDGTVFYADIHSTAITLAGSEYLVGCFRDATGRKQAGQALRESEARFRAIFEGVIDGIALADTATRRLEIANHAFCEMLGYSAAEVADLSVDDLHPTQELPRVHQVFEKQLGGELRLATELPIRRKEGTIFFADVNAMPITIGDRKYMLGCFRDVTERRQAEQALRESELRFRQLADNLPDVFFVLDRELKYTFWNTASERATGIAAKDAVGRSLFELFPDARGTEIDELYREVLQDRRPRSIENRYKLRGQERCFELTAYPVLEDVAVLAQDVTEERQLQASLAQSDRLASMGMLAAGVAHEINNPLTYMLYNLESLSEDIPRLAEQMRCCRDALARRLGDGPLNELLGEKAELLTALAAQDMVDRIRDAMIGARRIQEIARGLATFSRVEQQELVAVDVRYAVECAANMAFNEIKYRARLVKDLQPTDTVLGSEGRLSQVFLNLLVNAAHAIDEGDVDNNQIRVRTWQEGDEVCAEVRDTGTGIPPEHLAQIFEPFFSTKEVGAGSGLGLAISRNIATSYGGRIEVSSEVDKGSRFVVRLPVGKVPETTEAQPAKEQIAEPAVRGRILVIDDEPAIRKVIKRLLREHEVVPAGSGDEGRQILEQDQAFDLVLCDVMMPAMSGMTLHTWLAGTHPGLAERVVFITGGAFTPTAREYLAKVGNLQVEKPFDKVNFRTMIAELIVAFRARS